MDKMVETEFRLKVSKLSPFTVKVLVRRSFIVKGRARCQTAEGRKRPNDLTDVRVNEREHEEEQAAGSD